MKKRNLKLLLKKGTPTILTCVGSVGVIVTAVLTAKATVKAVGIIEDAKREKEEPLTKSETIMLVGPVYIPSVIVGVSTIACMFGANILNKKQQAMLSSAYALVQSSFKEYKCKLKELYGEETHNKIIDAIAAEKAIEMNLMAPGLMSSCNLSVEDSGSEPKLFYDLYGKRYFEATIEQVIQAEYHFNRNYVLRGYANLNELYEFLGLEQTDYGEVVGWHAFEEIQWVDFDHRKTMLDDGLECYILDMPFGPSDDYLTYKNW